jgi:CheY-like chemotaxis protein
VSGTPTVFFIDDSATMREVIKIAFRRENINVVAYNDAASALGQIEQAPPDVVITDVIMPDKDGYEVCQFIKQHPTLGNTPVILMSGVVNRTVAEKAFSVKADELIRKPFQPQDLITRVRHLLHLGGVPAPAPNQAAAVNAAAALSSIFQMPPNAVAAAAPMAAPRIPAARPAMPAAAPSPYAQPAYTPPPRQAVFPPPMAASAPAPIAAAPLAAPAAPVAPAVAGRSAMSGSGDISKLRLEVMRLEGLVKKLQSELQAEREYAKALEEHVKTLQEAE